MPQQARVRRMSPGRERRLRWHLRCRYGQRLPEYIDERGKIMAVGVVLEFDGATLEQYDQILEKMGYPPGGAGPPGGLFHWVTQTDGGIRVTDVWLDRETFERFAEEHIGPRSADVGLPSPPEITFFEVHNYLTAG